MHRAVFPATFDPIHNGHIDIAQRAALIFDEVVVGVYDHRHTVGQKKTLFTIEERLEMVHNSVLGTTPRVKVQPYSGLTVDFANSVDATVIVRGLRVFSDFELEFRMALANRRLAPDLDVVCLIASEQHMHLASSTIREIASLGGDVKSMVPAEVKKRLEEKFRHNPNTLVDVVSLKD